MHVLEHLYLLDFFDQDKINDLFSNVTISEKEEIDFAQKVFFVEVEEGVSILADLGMYLDKQSKLYIEMHIYVIKDQFWIEEYDLVYLNKYKTEAKTLIDWVRSGEKLLRNEIKTKKIPIKVYNTTKHKFKIAASLSDDELEEALFSINDFESTDRVQLKKKIDEYVTEENQKFKQQKSNDAKEVDRLILKSLKRYYEDKTDQALKQRNKDEFIKFSTLLNYYSKKLKKLYL